jgi:hypothetical protein
MYETHGYPIDLELRNRKSRERTEWRRRKVASLRRLLTILPAFARV